MTRRKMRGSVLVIVMVFIVSAAASTQDSLDGQETVQPTPSTLGQSYDDAKGDLTTGQDVDAGEVPVTKSILQQVHDIFSADQWLNFSDTNVTSASVMDKASTTASSPADRGFLVVARPTDTAETDGKRTVDRKAMLQQPGPCSGDPCKARGSCIETRSVDDEVIALCLCEGLWTGRFCDIVGGGAQWETWNEWSFCSMSCHRGWRVRHRNCRDADTLQVLNPAQCYGAPEEYGVCLLHDCPRWEPWGEWSQCSTETTCGPGTKTRTRTCSNGGKQGVDRNCLGGNNETSPCVTVPCDGPVKLVDGVNPGEGRVQLYDNIRGRWTYLCARAMTDYIAEVVCRQAGWPGAHTAVTDGRFGPASEMFFLSPLTCEGKEKRVAACRHIPWSQAGQCVGQGDFAAGVQCNVHGAWSLWSEWSVCSVTCENGTQTRTRSCDHPEQRHSGRPCRGVDTEHRPCTLQMCPIDGVWNSWSDWSECSVTCASGWQWRNRTCEGPYYLGAPCPGDGDQTRECHPRKCPVDGKWLPWSQWGECSLTCGNGTQWRSRECDGPFYDGANCTGPYDEEQLCNTHFCPVDGYYSEWGDWGECSVTCGGGSQLRNRNCTQPLYGGLDCQGPENETQGCQPQPCPVDGWWLDWTEWSACSHSCGPGEKERTRQCNEPQHGGTPCNGTSLETKPCNERSCFIPGDWFEWSPWTMCPVTCGGGKRYRERVCDMNSYQDLTAPCEGHNNETDDCHTYACYPYARTCTELGEWGLMYDTWADLDPDDPGPTTPDPKAMVNPYWTTPAATREPIQVYCDMASLDGVGVTIVGHDMESRTHVDGYEEPLNYDYLLGYNNVTDSLPLKDLYTRLTKIVDLSEHCEQYVKWECRNANIRNQDGDLFTSWLTRDERPAEYFGGAVPGFEGCACGMNGTCIDPETTCNCDANDEVWREDEGYLTFKDDLPMRGFLAGDTGSKDEEGYHTIGPLRCYGKDPNNQ